MTDALAALPRRVRRQLPNEKDIHSAFTCWVSDRDAVLVLSHATVVVVGSGGWFYDNAPLDSAWLTQAGEVVCDLRLHNTRRSVRFHTATDAQAAVRAFSDVAGRHNGGLKPLGPDERLVSRCVYLGGVNVPIPVKAKWSCSSAHQTSECTTRRPREAVS